MSYPKVRSRFLFLILFSTFVLAVAGTTGTAERTSAPQRLRIRVEHQRLNTGDGTKLIVEFLDVNYGQVANDATRVIEFGQSSPGSKQTGSGRIDPDRILVKPGAWSGEATFTSREPGRLLLTAASEGLESGQALVLIVSHKASSFLSLFETVAYAQASDSLEILPKAVSATADGRHRATFQLSFLETPPAGTIVRISTNLTAGGILYKGQQVGSTFANIKLEEGEDISGEISIHSASSGRFDVSASVRPNGPTDKAQVDFTPPRPTQIVFDAEPVEIESDAGNVPVTVRLADDGGFPIEPDRERRIQFSAAKESDQIAFEPESVVVAPGQPSAQVVFRLRELPLGNEVKILATSDQGIRAGQKSMVIKSAIERLVIGGPTEVLRSGKEAEYTIYLADKDGKPRAADWNRHIDLSVSGGSLATAQVVVPKGQRKAVVKYSPPKAEGKYVLTATSGGLRDGAYTIGVTNQVHWLVLLTLLGGMLGGVARQLHKDTKFERILPRWTGKYWDLGFAGRISGSVVGGLFFYWTLKFGLSQALSSPVMPAALDLGSRTVAFFLGGIGGFAGTVVLDRLSGWFLPGREQQNVRSARPAPQN